MTFFYYLASFFLCHANYTSINNAVFDKDSPPPGTVWIQQNYYLDKNEFCNIDYKEYQYWILRVLGENSAEYKAALLDAKPLEENFGFKNDYFVNRYYDNYPVVGISWEQAVNYSNWRTDRVCEMTLVEKGLIEFNPNQNAETYFTARKYFNGNYMDYEPIEEMEVAVYGLPTQEEWEELFSTIVTLKEKNKKYFHFVSSDKKRKQKPSFVGAKQSSEMPVNDLYGNVAEMTATKGLAKGGSWKNSLEESFPQKNINYTAPENWLGFRNKCEIIKMSSKK